MPFDTGTPLFLSLSFFHSLPPSLTDIRPLFLAVSPSEIHHFNDAIGFSKNHSEDPYGKLDSEYRASASFQCLSTVKNITAAPSRLLPKSCALVCPRLQHVAEIYSLLAPKRPCYKSMGKKKEWENGSSVCFLSRELLDGEKKKKDFFVWMSELLEERGCYIVCDQIELKYNSSFR